MNFSLKNPVDENWQCCEVPRCGPHPAPSRHSRPGTCSRWLAKGENLLVLTGSEDACADDAGAM